MEFNKEAITTGAKIILLGTLIYYALEDGKIGAGVDRLTDMLDEKEKEKKRGRKKQT